MQPKNDWRNHERRREEGMRQAGNSNRQNVNDGGWSRSPYNISVVSVPPVSVAGPYYDNRAFNAGDYGWRHMPANHGSAQAHQYGSAHGYAGYDQYGYPLPRNPYQQQVPYYAHQYDISSGSPRFDYESRQEEEQSPIEKRRKCRDVICLAFFAAAIGLSVAIAIYAIINGDLRRFTNGVDINCDVCGIQNDAKVGVVNSGKDLRFSHFLVTQKQQRPKFSKNSTFRFPLELQLGDLGVTGSVQSQNLRQCQTKCPSESKVVLNRCVSRRNFENENRTARINAEALTLDDVTDAVDDVTQIFEEVAEDVESSWQDILWICLISLGVAILVTILLRLFAGVIIWIVFAAIPIAAIGGSVALWILRSSKRAEYNQGQGSWTSLELNVLLAFAITVTVFTLLLLLVMLFMVKRIALLIKLFNVAGKAIHALPFILFQPLVTFVALGVAVSSWMVVALLIETSGTPVVAGQTCHYEMNTITIFSRWWNICMILWMIQFIVGCQHLVVGGAVSIWYFTRDKSKLGFPLALSYKRLVRNHLGSVAYGSLLIAILTLIRYILNIIKSVGKRNGFWRAILCCCKCFTWCIEELLTLLSENAYIEIAIYGYSFCKSAQKAVEVIANNPLRFATINSIGSFVLFLAKLSVVALSVFIGYEIISSKGNVTHIWVPLTLGGIFSYFVAHCFISIYEITIDAVFICFCEDCEMNDGHEKPYYMSKGLMEFVKNNEKELAKQNKEE